MEMGGSLFYSYSQEITMRYLSQFAKGNITEMQEVEVINNSVHFT